MGFVVFMWGSELFIVVYHQTNASNIPQNIHTEKGGQENHERKQNDVIFNDKDVDR